MRKLDLSNEYQKLGKENLDKITQQLKYHRIRFDLTQKEVAELAGISVSTISKLENGRYPTRLVWFAALIAELGGRLVITERV